MSLQTYCMQHNLRFELACAIFVRATHAILSLTMVAKTLYFGRWCHRAAFLPPALYDKAASSLSSEAALDGSRMRRLYPATVQCDGRLVFRSACHVYDAGRIFTILRDVLTHGCIEYALIFGQHV